MRAIGSGKNRQFLSQGLGQFLSQGLVCLWAGRPFRSRRSLNTECSCQGPTNKKEEPTKVMCRREDSLWNRRTMEIGMREIPLTPVGRSDPPEEAGNDDGARSSHTASAGSGRALSLRRPSTPSTSTLHRYVWAPDRAELTVEGDIMPSEEEWFVFSRAAASGAYGLVKSRKSGIWWARASGTNHTLGTRAGSPLGVES